MKRRFVERVAVEREVLDLVNRQFQCVELCGLSQAAISRWHDSVERVPDEVVNLVVTIAKRARLDVDASRDVFIDGEEDLVSTTTEYIQELRELLGSKDRNHV